MAASGVKSSPNDSGHRTNSLAFAKLDCHTCAALKKHCDRKRPRCDTCISSRQRCGGFAMDLVWKDLAVSNDAITSTPSQESGSYQRQTQISRKRPDFKFIRGRSKIKRKPKKPDYPMAQPSTLGATESLYSSNQLRSPVVAHSPEISNFDISKASASSAGLIHDEYGVYSCESNILGDHLTLRHALAHGYFMLLISVLW
jgi:hypothetical protein